MIVVDASAALAWAFKNQRSASLVEVLRLIGREGAIAPQLWPIEVAAVVLKAARRNELPQARVPEVLEALRSLDLEIDGETTRRVWSDTVQLAMKHRLTVYDATYLELALRRQRPIATLDDELAAAARAEGLTVLP